MILIIPVINKSLKLSFDSFVTVLSSIDISPWPGVGQISLIVESRYAKHGDKARVE